MVESSGMKMMLKNVLAISTDISHTFSNSLFNKIPNEMISCIFRYLSVPDLCNVSLVCRSFKMIADQDDVWKHKFNSKSNSCLCLCIIYENN